MNTVVLINTIVYALIGIAIFVLGFIAVDKMTPYDLWKEVVEKQNLALSVLLGLGALGICIIIAAAIH